MNVIQLNREGFGRKRCLAFLLPAFLLFLPGCGSDSSATSGTGENTESSPSDDQRSGQGAQEKETDTQSIPTDILSGEEFLSFMTQQADGISLWNFVKPGCEACWENAQTMENLRQQSGSGFKIFNVLLVKGQDVIDKNKQEIKGNPDSPVIRVEEEKDLFSKIDEGWNGALPAVLVRDAESSTSLLYQQNFSEGELFAILQTLSL